jgi:excisionase family DNA binding protein
VKPYTLSPADVAKTLNKSPQFVAREIMRGRLAGIKVGRTFRIAQDDLEDYLSRSIVIPSTGYSDEFQSAIGRQQLEADDRYCTDKGT